LGLIVTELTTNAIKHAFPDTFSVNGEPYKDKRARPDESAQPRPAHSVQIDFHQMGDMLVLEARDNGVGLPPGLDWRTARSLGLRLVNRLAEQIHGELEVEGGAGTCFRLTFPVGEMDD
jgi:two-component sensor histidine kinase